METKRDIRKMMTALRAAMSEKERAEAGRIIAARLFSSKVYEDAGTVCCYASFGSEVPTEEIIEESLRRGKCAAVPKVTGKQKMKFALIHSTCRLYYYGKGDDHMSAGLPRDPVMLLSVVNTKLRDYYSTLDVLCEDMQVDKQELIGKLEMIDYTYDAGSNQFV